MIIRCRRPKNFFKEYGLDSSAYSILDIMKLLGVEIVSVNKKYEKDYILAVTIPDNYENEFFGKLTSLDVCKFLENKISDQITSDYTVIVVLVQGNKFNKYWTEMDFFDMKNQIIWKNKHEFINILEHGRSALVPVKRIRKK